MAGIDMDGHVIDYITYNKKSKCYNYFSNILYKRIKTL